MFLRPFLTIAALCAALPLGVAAKEPLFQHIHTFKGAPEENDVTGLTLALTETHAFVGSPWAKGPSPKVIARIHDAAATSLISEVMTPATLREGNVNGRVAAMAGDRVPVCNAGRSTSPPEQNDAWQHDVTSGDRLVRFHDPSGGSGSIFAHACALTGRHALISAPGYSAVEEHGGVAYLFDAQTGALLREFHPPKPQKLGEFGATIFLSDRYAAISQPFRAADRTWPGAVYVYDLESGDLVQTFEKHEDDRGFVASLSLQGDLILIGRTFGRADQQKTGRIDIYDIKTREHVLRILPPERPLNNVFGRNAVWSRDEILVGATDLPVGNEVEEGLAFLFDATTGKHLQTFARPEKGKVGVFPSRIAMAGGRILLTGLYRKTDLGGEVYLFERTSR